MREEFLNLSVWDDSELDCAFGMRHTTREKLRHWPLCYTERVDFECGSYVVKYSQLGIESEFYRAAGLPFMTGAALYGKSGETDIIALPFIEGREPDDTETATALEMLSSAEVHNVPVWLDISHYGKFTDMAKYSAALLVKHGSSLDLSKLGEVCVSLEHLWDGKDAVGLVHGDLKRDNILVCSDGIKIIDWQRPMFAPKIIDGVSALTVTDADAARLAKLIEAYWLLYAFDKKLGALGHVFKWAEKDIADVI